MWNEIIYYCNTMLQLRAHFISHSHPNVPNQHTEHRACEPKWRHRNFMFIFFFSFSRGSTQTVNSRSVSFCLLTYIFVVVCFQPFFSTISFVLVFMKRNKYWEYFSRKNNENLDWKSDWAESWAHHALYNVC